MIGSRLMNPADPWLVEETIRAAATAIRAEREALVSGSGRRTVTIVVDLSDNRVVGSTVQIELRPHAPQVDRGEETGGDGRT
jgi:hypothetical protein